jgi:hypothetical protein
MRTERRGGRRCTEATIIMRCGPGTSLRSEKCFCSKGVRAVVEWIGWCWRVKKALRWVVEVRAVNDILKKGRRIVLPLRINDMHMIEWRAIIIGMRR